MNWKGNCFNPLIDEAKTKATQFFSSLCLSLIFKLSLHQRRHYLSN